MRTLNEKSYSSSKYQSKYQEARAKIQNEDSLNDRAGVGWNISLEHPERFEEVIEYCAAMGQKEYDAMSQRTFEYANKLLKTRRCWRRTGGCLGVNLKI